MTNKTGGNVVSRVPNVPKENRTKERLELFAVAGKTEIYIATGGFYFVYPQPTCLNVGGKKICIDVPEMPLEKKTWIQIYGGSDDFRKYIRKVFDKKARVRMFVCGTSFEAAIVSIEVRNKSGAMKIEYMRTTNFVAEYLSTHIKTK